MEGLVNLTLKSTEGSKAGNVLMSLSHNLKLERTTDQRMSTFEKNPAPSGSQKIRHFVPSRATPIIF